jgi:hypothetical protein
VKYFFFLIFLGSTFISLTACDQDPFGLACRKVDGAGYTLCRWEDGKTYYLESVAGPPKDGGGVLDGIVERIGWNSRFVVAYRYATFRGDKDGWMVIDTGTHKIDGSIGDAVEAARFPNLKPLDAAAAWQKLP